MSRGSTDIEIQDNSQEILSELNNAVDKALEEIGLTAERYAKLNCPVGTPESTGIPHYQGGTLRNSITHEVQEKTAYIGTNVEYAPYVEMGTRYMHPRPYLKPAVEEHVDEYRKIMESNLGKL